MEPAIMENLHFIWTDSTHEMFQHFYLVTEEYYSSLVGGREKRKGFIPYNISDMIQDVILAYIGEKCVGCAGLKKYSEHDAEIKRVWVEPEYRGMGIATKMMSEAEKKAIQNGSQRAILQTREIMYDAVRLYQKLGYMKIPNYPPYDALDGAVCYAHQLG